MKRKLMRIEVVRRSIFEIRGKKVILDADLAELYGVTVKRLNEQVKRNFDRFPSDFMFQLTKEEHLRCQFGIANMAVDQGKLRSQFATAKFSMRRALPYAFTRNGVNMLATSSDLRLRMPEVRWSTAKIFKKL